MPDTSRHTRRLRRLQDVCQARAPCAVVFTGADSARALARLRRLAPPKGTVCPVTSVPEEGMGFYGSDASAYDRRTRRYVEVGQSRAARGGAPIFSGACAELHSARMMRLCDKV